MPSRNSHKNIGTTRLNIYQLTLESLGSAVNPEKEEERKRGKIKREDEKERKRKKRGNKGKEERRGKGRIKGRRKGGK